MNSYLYVKVSGYSKEKMISKISNLKINIYNVACYKDYIIIKIDAKDYGKLTKYIKTLNFKKIKYTGKEYFKRTFKIYQLTIISVLISILFIIFCSFFIVDIKVVHENTKLVELLTEELNNYGVKKFRFKKSYKKLQEIKKKIKNEHLDEIDWLEINKKGMTYIVRVEERLINKKETKKEYCHVYALKDGLIKTIKNFEGQALLLINDYVKKGDVIVSGDILLNEEVVEKVCADAKVYAEIWYKVSVNVPFNHYEEIKTGKKRNNIIINVNDKDYQILKNRLNNYKSTKKVIFNSLGIKVIIRKDYEIKKIAKKYTTDEAIKEGIKLAKEKVLLSLTKGDKIVKEKVLQKDINDSTINLEIFIVSEEQIGIQKELKET